MVKSNGIFDEFTGFRHMASAESQAGIVTDKCYMPV